MDSKINCFLNRDIIKSTCTVTGAQISVSTDGMIGVCQGYMGNRKTFDNSVFDLSYNPAEDPLFKEWNKRTTFNIKECHSCIALATCGGGCPRNAEKVTGSIWGLDKGFCHFSKRAQEWMIWKYFETCDYDKTFVV